MAERDDGRKPYETVSALGAFCQTAYQLRRLSKNAVSGPLDWTFCDFRPLLRCLDTNFEGFAKFANLRINSDLKRVIDNYTGVVLYHQFPKDEKERVFPYELEDHYAILAPKLDHLIQNFRAIQGRHLFVWSVNEFFLEHVPARSAATTVLERLRKTKPDCELLVVQSSDKWEDAWNDPGIHNRYAPFPADRWQGDDAAWEGIGAEFGFSERHDAQMTPSDDAITYVPMETTNGSQAGTDLRQAV